MTRGAVRTWFADRDAPKSKGKRDLYSFAARARQQGRQGLANDLASLADDLESLEGRVKMWSNVTLEGKGAAPMDSARGGGDGMPAEVRASLAVRDAAERVREIVRDWCE